MEIQQYDCTCLWQFLGLPAKPFETTLKYAQLDYSYLKNLKAGSKFKKNKFVIICKIIKIKYKLFTSNLFSKIKLFNTKN